MIITRRTFLGGLGASASLTLLPATAFGQSGGAARKRLVFLFLRGGVDGLDVVSPLGDPDYRRLREGLARTSDNATDLDGFFALASEMPQLLAQYRAGEALLVPATAGPHRERSHFEAQALVEYGQSEMAESGWLARLSALIDDPDSDTAEALALGTTRPLSLAGTEDPLLWAPSRLPAARPRFTQGLEALYAQDPRLQSALASAQDTNTIVASAFEDGDLPKSGDPAALAQAATAFLSADEGPSIAMMDLGGFDTHANQRGAITGPLSALDATLATLKSGMGSTWSDTTVVALSEFGRTAFANGTNGTDHGTGGVTIVTGGAVHGGKVGGLWPGLSPSDLFEERDLAATTDQRALLKAIARNQFGLGTESLDTQLFPDSATIAPYEGLYR